MTINEAKLEKFLGKMVTDLGAALVGTNVIICDQLGLYKALATNGALTSDQLAEQTGTNERYVREWLSGQAASGYVEYDAQGQRFYLTPEQMVVFADTDSPVLMTGGYSIVQSVYNDVLRLTEAFRNGSGMSWGDHCHCLFCGTEKFFGPSYRGYLVSKHHL